MTALELFRASGFAATTVEEIAAAAEVSKGTFFNYFPSKEALLHYLGERQSEATRAELTAVLQDATAGTRAKLALVLGRVAQSLEADRDLARVAVLEVMKVPHALLADPARRLFREALASLVADGQRRGDVSAAVDASLAASALVGVFFQQVFEWCTATEPYPLPERLEQLVALLWRGLAAEGGRG